MKNPRARPGTVTGDYDAREVFGDEKAICARAVAVWPPATRPRRTAGVRADPVRAGG